MPPAGAANAVVAERQLLHRNFEGLKCLVSELQQVNVRARPSLPAACPPKQLRLTVSAARLSTYALLWPAWVRAAAELLQILNLNRCNGGQLSTCSLMRIIMALCRIRIHFMPQQRQGRASATDLESVLCCSRKEVRSRPCSFACEWHGISSPRIGHVQQQGQLDRLVVDPSMKRWAQVAHACAHSLNKGGGRIMGCCCAVVPVVVTSRHRCFVRVVRVVPLTVALAHCDACSARHACDLVPPVLPLHNLACAADHALISPCACHALGLCGRHAAPLSRGL